MPVTWICVGIALVAALFFYKAKKRVQRRAACHALYAVRDDLVCLVAEGQLSEDSQLFQHYYGRVNRFLSAVPKVGFDDALSALITLRKNGDARKSLEQARRTIESLDRCPEMRVPEVRKVVAAYYQAIGQTMIAHSSLSRFVYLHLMHDRVTQVLDRVSPQFSQEVKVAKFAVNRSSALVNDPAYATAA